MVCAAHISMLTDWTSQTPRPNSAIRTISILLRTFAVSDTTHFLQQTISSDKLDDTVDYSAIDLPVFTCSARDYVRIKGKRHQFFLMSVHSRDCHRPSEG